MASGNRQRNVMAAMKYLYSRFAGQMPTVPEYSFDNNKMLQVRAAANDRDWPLMGNDTNDITQFANPNGLNTLALSTSQLATPSAPTVAVVGTTGSTTWAYKVVAKDGNGGTVGTTAASSAGQVTTGNATLTAANYNNITWTAVSGAQSYDIYRTTAGGTPNTTGKIGNVVTQIISDTTLPLSLQDTGLTGDASTAPSTNTTGAAYFAGPVTFAAGGAFSDTTTLTAITTAGAATWTAAQIVGAGEGTNLITRNCNGASRTDVTDTATNIVAAISGAVVGSSVEVDVKNISSAGQDLTLSGGVGVTFPNDTALTIPSGASAILLFRVTNVGAPAVTVYLEETYGGAITDSNGNRIIDLSATASAVDRLIVTNAATANPATVSAGTVGSDANINLNLTTTGTGTLQATVPSTNAQPSFTVGNVASAVDGVTITPAATANPATVIVAGTGTDANIHLQLNSKGTGAVKVFTPGANAQPSVTVAATASAVDGITITPAATANPATVAVGTSGTDANIKLNLTTTGTGTLIATVPSTNAQPSFTVANVASAVDGITITPAATANPATVAVGTTGTDANIKLNLTTTGTGTIIATVPSTNAQPSLTIANVASAVDGLTITPAATANPASVNMAATGTDSNLNLTLTQKGSGVVQAKCLSNLAQTSVTYSTPTYSLDPTAGTFLVGTTGAGAITINAASVLAAGTYLTLVINNDAGAGRTITFGTNFRSTGTLTGTASKVMIIVFASDASNWIELSRTVAIT